MKNTTLTQKNSSYSRVRLISVTAMFAALVTLATAFIKIPTALGYQHPGDSMVYLAASILPGPYGMIASSIGGALADLISGYAQWAIPTAVIKALNALPFILCRMVLQRMHKDKKIINIPALLMLIPTTAVTVFGYFIANWLMYGWGGAAAELVTWWVQPGIGALLFVAMGIGLDAVKFKEKIAANFLR